MIEFLSAVLLVSTDPRRMVAFYRDVLGLPLRDEAHDDTHPHFGCELGDVHFAIHPVENFERGSTAPQSAVRLAFTVFDMAGFMERLASHGVQPLYEPRDVGFAIMTALRDPDGNYLEFTQLSESWLRHLESRRQAGNDILLKWRSQPPPKAPPTS